MKQKRSDLLSSCPESNSDSSDAEEYSAGISKHIIKNIMFSAGSMAIFTGDRTTGCHGQLATDFDGHEAARIGRQVFFN